MDNVYLFMLISLIGVLVLASVLLIINFKKLETQNREINNFNKMRETFIDADQSLIYLKDENLKYIFVNKAFKEVIKKNSSEIIGYDDFDLIDEDLANMFRETDLYALEEKATIKNEIKIENKIFQVKKFPVKLTNDSYGVGAYIREITKEYNNKRELKEINAVFNRTNNLLLSILESSPEIIVFALDTDYRYISFNKNHKKAMKQIWGKDIEIGMNMLEVIGRHNDRIKSKENFDRVLEGGNFTLIEEYGDKELSRLTWQDYYSPIYSNDGKVIGLTCFVLNITKRKKAEEEIVYLSYHDLLTGLYNRRFFEEEISRVDIKDNLPISIIMGDVNGLKQTNDIFGHIVGDMLLQKAAEVMKNQCRKDDIIARCGGDEFMIILPKTTEEEVEEIARRIKEKFSKERIKAFNGSISLGYDTKNLLSEDIVQVIEDAENKMYLDKTLSGKKFKDSIIKTTVKTLHQTISREEEHSKNVSKLCQQIGKAMNLSEDEIRILKNAGFFHDIGKVAIEDTILNKEDTLTEKEWEKIKHHPIVGYRILNFSDDTLELSKYVLSHHERWDGTGYPKGLKGEAIPKLARIISIAECYDSMINGSTYKKAMSKEEAILEIKKNSGVQFDPYIVEVFIKMIQ